MSGINSPPLAAVLRDQSRSARRGGGPSTPHGRKATASSSSSTRGGRNSTLNSYWTMDDQTQPRAPPATMVSPSRTTAFLPEPERPAAAACNSAISAAAEGTQHSLTSEDAKIQATVDRLDRKRDQRDLDFVGSQPIPKKARVESAPATPTTPVLVKRKGGGTKRFDDCSLDTQEERLAHIKGIETNWKVPHTEWMPEHLLSRNEPKDWDKPLLGALRDLSNLAPGHGLADARRAMSAAHAERAVRGLGTTRLTAEDVKAAITELSRIPTSAERSPTLTPAAIVQPVTIAGRSTSEGEDAEFFDIDDSVTGEVDQLLSVTTAEPVVSSRRAEQQAVEPEHEIELEPAAESTPTRASSFELLHDEMRDSDARIDEIYKLKAIEAKARAKRLVLESKQKRWEALHSRDG